MRSSTYIALFAGSAAAQSSVSLFNLYPYQTTLTQIGSDATATTYQNVCPSEKAGISVLPSSLRPTPDSPGATITPAPTPRVRYARQATPTASAGDDDDGFELCEPYTLKQGGSTWEIHMTDPSPGAWTVDVNCKWQGAIADADLTCVATADGYVVDQSDRGTTTTVISKDEVSTMSFISAYAVVTSSGSASQTPSGSGAKSGAPTASGSTSGSSAAGAAPSTGLAPAGPMPTGAVAFIGGAAGVFAAALAL
ncbi:hypothetical protein HBI13_024850 [Parastagonospora nodorum]|nr:hypothetical protein HBI10_041400 [Parastagonospora nodorum]KAH4030786.1 hypothetical protein HBI13_024850 [Parastagonospora nodorum]